MMLFFLVDFLQNPYIILIEDIIKLHVKIWIHTSKEYPSQEAKDIWKKTRIDSTHCSYQTLSKKDKSTYLLIFGTGDGFSFQLQNLHASFSHQAAMTTDHWSNWQHLSHSCTPCQKHVADHTIFSTRTWTVEWHKFETRAIQRQSKFYTQQSRRVKAYSTWSWFCSFLPSHFSLLSVSLNKF